ncbi:rolling circle replication-associated protein [Clostridioides difficile]|nr:Uncharacterised protein [Clostridioides difficile]HBG0292078.1 hypothetical protein [Clostridioides difficile]HBG2115417.1 hypothetical protein [Clostridioides difficile]HBG2166077.1 hypothetical protein [Clostridioides difficile]
MKSFIREKKIYCSDYLEIDIIPRTDMTKGKRGKKEYISKMKQKNLNDKNAKRYFIQLANTNFNNKDLVVHFTYAPKFLPSTVEEAEREARNYIRRINHRRKREGLGAIKYLLITEFGEKKNGTKRVHHHMILSGELDRDIIESLWVRKSRGKKEGEKLGWINTHRLQPNEFGLQSLCNYLMKDPRGRKRWSSSQNLEKPYQRCNDSRYSKKKVMEIVRNDLDNRIFWEKQYKGYIFTECKAAYNDITGVSLYIKMRRLN